MHRSPFSPKGNLSALSVSCVIALLLFAAPALSAPDGSVQNFGAVGDGRADDTAAVERAVASGSVFFPKGIYRLTRTIRIELEKTGFSALSSDGTSRIVMEAAGPAFHFVGNHGGTADPKSVPAGI